MTETLQIKKRLVENSRISEVDFSKINFGRVYSDHMLTCDYIDGKWQDAQIVPYDYLKFLPGSAILHYGQSVFEGLKAYRDVDGSINVFRPEMNARRLNASARRLCIPEVPEELFLSGMTELLKVDKAWVPGEPDTALYIRPFVFALDEYIGIRPSESYKFIIFTCPVGSYYSKPVKVKVETNYTRAIEGGTGFAKAAGNYAGSLYPAKQAQLNGYDQLLWTDGKSHKYIEESGTMNVMFLIGDKLVTASTGDTVLPGITRASVIELAKSWGVTVEERKVAVDEVIGAIKSGELKEAFGVGTAATIVQIEVINYDGVDYKLPDVNSGEFAKRIKGTLDDIKVGKKPDEYGWLLKI